MLLRSHFGHQYGCSSTASLGDIDMANPKIEQANAILRNAIEDGRTLTAEEIILLERLTRQGEKE